MSIVQWTGRTNARAFSERFRAALQEAFPGAAIEQGQEELELRIEHPPPDNYKQTVWLSRAYREFCETPDQVDEILARWMRSVAAWREDGFDVDDIIPVVKDSRWVGQQGGLVPWTEPYNSELVLVFAVYRNSLRFHERTVFEALGLPFEELRERAFANLRRRIKEISVTGANGEYLLGAGGTIDSSLLLLNEVTQDPRMQFAGDPLIGISDRDSFWVADDANPYAVFGIGARVAQFYRSEPYPISPQLFFKQGGVWQPLDPVSEDNEHAIPKLDVLDIVATKKAGGADLVVIVSRPLGADARSVFRLLRKLDVYLHEINTDSWRDEHGAATPESTNIIVKLHPDSDPVVAKLLHDHSGWAAKRGARLIAEELEL
jgi:uncharacterized protein YtpQ (UPF0354 family)